MRVGVVLVTLIGVSFLVARCDRSLSPAAPSSAQVGNVASVPATAARTGGKLRVDQSNSVSDGLSLCSGLRGQTVTPRAKNLAQVDLLLTINTLQSDVMTTVEVFTEITQAPVATTQALVRAAAPGELRRAISYQFDPPVSLEKKGTYTIGFHALTDACWEFAFGDPYPGGQAVLADGTSLNPPADFVFTTYELK